MQQFVEVGGVEYEVNVGNVKVLRETGEWLQEMKSELPKIVEVANGIDVLTRIEGMTDKGLAIIADAIGEEAASRIKPGDLPTIIEKVAEINAASSPEAVRERYAQAEARVQAIVGSYMVDGE